MVENVTGSDSRGGLAGWMGCFAGVLFVRRRGREFSTSRDIQALFTLRFEETIVSGHDHLTFFRALKFAFGFNRCDGVCIFVFVWKEESLRPVLKYWCGHN